MSDLTISFDDVARAHERLQGVAHRTPVWTSSTVDALTGARVYFKCEQLQRMGAFKIRGAYNAIAQFTPAQRAAGVVAYSSGNHAQAIALAGRLLGVRAVIAMPADAPQAKLDATRGYGGEVVIYDRYAEDGQAVALRLAQAQGLTLVPPFDHLHVMAGQGTAAKELLEDVGELDVLLTPVGGGGLLSGTALAAQGLSPRCRLVGVEPQAGNDGQRSLERGEIVRIDTPRTVADAAQSRYLGEHPFGVLKRLAARIVTVTDDELVEAMRFIAMRMKAVVEPTGCLGAAAVLSRKLDLRGLRVGVVLSGGNVDLARYATLLANQPAG
jgi:threonine dehydratase